nr:hypothetical protein [Tanacetum cinerariifolium]
FYYVEGLNHNLFSVGQFCDADLEVAFQKSTCFVRDHQALPTQAWLWHRRLSYLNFDYINMLLKKDVVIGLPKLKFVKDQICSSCELSKAKKSSFKSKAVSSSKGRLNLFHMDLCGPMRVASINGKKYILKVYQNQSLHRLYLKQQGKLTKKPNVVPINTRKPKAHATKSVATPHKKKVASKSTTQKPKSYYRMLYEKTSKACKWWIEQQCPSGYKWVPKTKIGTEFLNKTLNAFFKEEGIEHQTSTARTPEQNGVVERQNRTLVEVARTMLSPSKLPLFFWAEASDYDNSDPVTQLHNVSSSANAHVPSQQELDLLFDPLYDEFFTAGSSSVNKSSSPINNFNQKDTQPTTNIQFTSAPSTPTYVHAEENNDNQAEEEHLQDDEFTNPFCAPVQEGADSSSHNIGNSNVPTFSQP